MKNFVFLGAPVAPLPERDSGFHAHFAHSGENTGNLLIGQSFRELLKYDSAHFGEILQPAEMNERFDMLVVSAANFIYPKADMGFPAQIIESCNLPVMIAGLGAQAPDHSVRSIELPPGTLRFLSVVSERARIIGVRGHYTAEILNGLGVKNVMPLGCPSLYRSHRRDLKITKREAHPGLKVSLNGSRNVLRHASSVQGAVNLERQLVLLAKQNNYSYVLQNEFPELEIVSSSERDLALNEEQLAGIVVQLRLGFDKDVFREHIRRHCVVFHSLEEWDAYIQGMDFSLGSRFHGNVIALTNGVPAVVFAHDSRTTELCELTHIPHIRLENAGLVDPLAIYNAADFSGFEVRYRQLYDEFARFLDICGVEHRLEDAQKPNPPGGAVQLS